jgi:Mn2+/Fe2+ NRAMP family transporter
MNMITTVTIGFLILEVANVITLYFFPESKYANGVGVFKAWEKSIANPEIHNFIKYLVYWVAGTKLIFILLLVIILLTGNHQTLLFSSIALAISVASFFWRLFPLIRQMDRDGQIDPKNYSTVLAWMITAIIIVFSCAFLVSMTG